MQSDGIARLSVLHVILNLGAANGQYNEHCLPMADLRDLSVCTYFKPELICPESIDLFPGDGRLPGFVRAFRAALSAKDYDVIHVHAPQSGAIVLLALLGGLKYRRLRAKTVYTVQDSFHDYRLRNRVMMVMALAGYRHIVFCSRASYDSLPKRWRWLVRGRWRVVQNGVDIDRIDRALADDHDTVARNQNVFTVLSVGRLEPVKAPLRLLEAFAAAADDRSALVFVGAGSVESTLRERVQQLGLAEGVTFTGLVPRDEVFRRCARADVLVSTSHGEGLPVAVMEAMAAGCPVILSDIPPHRELARGADHVALVPIDDANAFAEHIRRFQAMPRADRQKVGCQGRAHVEQRFALPIMHAEVESLYRQVAGYTGPRAADARAAVEDHSNAR